EARTLAAARRIVDAGAAIPVRIGVHRGAVFAGDVGPHYRRTYTVMGDTVNLAARLMAAGPPGHVYASAPVVERAAGFGATALEPMQVKGKRAPVYAFDIGAARTGTGATLSARTLDLPFVGREAELAMLVQLSQQANAGHGAMVSVAGTSGIGKTRL